MRDTQIHYIYLFIKKHAVKHLVNLQVDPRESSRRIYTERCKVTMVNKLVQTEWSVYVFFVLY